MRLCNGGREKNQYHFVIKAISRLLWKLLYGTNIRGSNFCHTTAQVHSHKSAMGGGLYLGRRRLDQRTKFLYFFCKNNLIFGLFR